jgi:Na+/alanine symporter
MKPDAKEPSHARAIAATINETNNAKSTFILFATVTIDIILVCSTTDCDCLLEEGCLQQIDSNRYRMMADGESRQ